jgi:methionyl-tRNA formyltransferase
LFPLLDRCPEPPGQLLTFNHLARAYGVSFHGITEINQGDGYALLEAFRPDLVLSLRFDLIFKSRVIRLPRYGILNIHPGTLPRHAGLYAPFRAMLAGESSAGCTLHMIDEGIDSGPIVGLRHLPVDPGRSTFWHMLHLYPLGVELFLEALATLEAGKPLDAHAQDRSQREYRSYPSAEDFTAFEAKGLRLVDPESDWEFLMRFCRSVDAPAPSRRAKGSSCGGPGTRTPMTLRSEVFKFSLVRFVLR